MKKLAAVVLAGSLIAACAASPARGAVAAAIAATHGVDAQKFLGTGKGVTIAVLDGGIDGTHPALRGSIFAERDFTGQNTVDDLDGAGHGTGIAGILVGHDGRSYAGLAPAAKLINARVSTGDDYTTNLWAGNGLMWSAQKGARVVNISFGNPTSATGPGNLTERFTLMTDYVAERYGVNVVIAGGNDGQTSVAQVPGGGYNTYTVGALDGRAYQRVAKFSNRAMARDERSKPDLVAPGQRVSLAAADWEKDTNYFATYGTSYAAPMVGGVLAEMIGYGKARGLPTDPLLMKAILMTSAAKVHDTGGEGWYARQSVRDPDYGRVYTRPLDDQQGAGALDAMAAYQVYAKKKAGTTAVAAWREGKMKENQTQVVKLGKLSAGQRVDATLTWFRHVGYTDKNDNGPDGKDAYAPVGTLADFTLTLVKDGVPVASSDSDVDNLEHLSWMLAASGDYSLEVYRFTESGAPDEDYAVAARVLKAAGTASVRRSMAVEAELNATNVPEPGMGVLIVLGTMWMAGKRRRRQDDSKRSA